MELGKDFELVTGQVYVRASGTHVLERLLNRRQPGSSLPASPARRASAAPMSSITGTPPAPPPSRVRAGPSLSLPGLAASQPVDGAPSPFTPVASMSREELLASMKKSARAATNPDVDLVRSKIYFIRTTSSTILYIFFCLFVLVGQLHRHPYSFAVDSTTITQEWRLRLKTCSRRTHRCRTIASGITPNGALSH